MNPGLDIGQVEGALIMGLGYVLYEKEIYDPESGRLLTNSTWVSPCDYFVYDNTLCKQSKNGVTKYDWSLIVKGIAVSCFHYMLFQ